MDIFQTKHIHFTGIKGVGMTSLALCAQDMGIKVSGSDTDELFVTDEVLKKRGISWRVGFSAKNLPKNTDLLITTGAHGGLSNIEVLEAKKRKIPVITQAEALKVFAQGKDTICVCGVGGKTTTASMIATVLEKSGLKPSYAIGVSEIFPLGFGGKYDRGGKHFICEADEFVASPGVDNTPKFFYLLPKVVVVTNIEYDHPDIYPSLEDTKKVFLKFFNKIPADGLLVANIDNENVKQVLKKYKGPKVTFGKSNKIDFSLNIPGEYNVYNATAAAIVGNFLGIDYKKIKKALSYFSGTKRRFEKIGKSPLGFEIYDDYAHHPKEIKEVLKAAKTWFGKRRIIAIFQPHTYSRTKALFSEFAKSFSDADIVGLMDVYTSAREKKDESVSSEKLSREAGKYHKNAYYLGNHQETIDWVKSVAKKGDLVLTLGAGDIFHIHDKLIC